MKRWQNSITATIAITMVAAMMVGYGIQVLIDNSLFRFGLTPMQIFQSETPKPLQQLPGKVAAMIELLDATPQAQRNAVIAATQRGDFHLRPLNSEIKNLHIRNDMDATAFHNRIQSLLSRPHRIVIADKFVPQDQQAATTEPSVQKGVYIEAALSDRHWLLFSSDFGMPPNLSPALMQIARASVAARVVLTILLCTLLAVVAARRLARPLSQLAVAVEQLGGNGEAPAIPLNGPREVRRAIIAFNRMRDRLRRFNEDRTRMIAAMSHDLRTPLTRLRMRAELVADTDQQNRMLFELDKMNGLIDSILSFAKDDSRNEPRSLVDLSALVEGICEDAADAGEPVTFSGPREVTISCRPAALRRAVSNLVDNAVKYGRTAAVTLMPGPELVVLTIEDEGPGIPRHERERVFEPFYRIDPSRNPDTGGVGLGLSVTRSIIWEHGGDISLGNRKGGGLLVRLELPARSHAGSFDEAKIGVTEVMRETRVEADNV